MTFGAVNSTIFMVSRIFDSNMLPKELILQCRPHFDRASLFSEANRESNDCFCF